MRVDAGFCRQHQRFGYRLDRHPENKIVDQWNLSSKADESLVIKLSEGELKETMEYFKEKIKHKMKEKIIFEADPKIKAGFSIEPKNGKFKIGFTDKDFEELFSFFLRPRIQSFLFKVK